MHICALKIYSAQPDWLFEHFVTIQRSQSLAYGCLVLIESAGRKVDRLNNSLRVRPANEVSFEYLKLEWSSSFKLGAKKSSKSTALQWNHLQMHHVPVEPLQLSQDPPSVAECVWPCRKAQVVLFPRFFWDFPGSFQMLVKNLWV